ncbi:MAG: NADH:ubiquinone reductase (Na(+)-transporting) subunit C [Bacteroidota bacterium]
MQHSNGYIIKFVIVLTLVLSLALALAKVVLTEPQRIAKDLDNKKQILTAMREIEEGEDPLKLYEKHVESIIVDINGDIVEAEVSPEKIDIEREYKKPSDDQRRYPVFQYREKEGGPFTAYILPVYGKGLWDDIWGYVAMSPDYTKVLGAKFGHAGETPGLGARITEGVIQDRYKGKSIRNSKGEIVGVEMIKGENNPPSKIADYQVDGMAGATITAVGVNDMLEDYLKDYHNYFEKKAKGNTAEVLR